jgi:glycosyltransferase involved in cell wall biosynthesis
MLPAAYAHRLMTRPRILLAIPVYNEERYVSKVLSEVRAFVAPHGRRCCQRCGVDSVLVVDDGSTDATPMELAKHRVEVIRHAENRGYGRSMQDMLRWASFDRFDWLITMDCDEQHEPAAIPAFAEAICRDDADVISGSRYLVNSPLDDLPPGDRRRINATITEEVRDRLGLHLTDSFCGFKAYRVAACEKLDLGVDGYDFPMQFWPQAVAHGLRIREIPVRLIYNDPNRSFGGPLDDPTHRLTTYRQTMHREILRLRDRLPASATDGLELRDACCCCPRHAADQREGDWAPRP